MKPTRNRYFLDLFAGCGGLSLGLEKAGFIPAFVNEINPDAMETYLINRENEYPLLRQKYHIDDVWKLVKNDELLNSIVKDMKEDYGFNAFEGELDLLVGGPPCQGFSGIGYRRSYSVEKSAIPSNHLYKAMAKLIGSLQPKIFLFENVKGILSGRWSPEGIKGEIWEDVLQEYSTIQNYNIGWKLVHAKDYGAPQNRPRVLMVGLRKDIFKDYTVPESGDPIEAGFLPQPTFDFPNLDELLGDLINDEFSYGGQDLEYLRGAKTKIQKEFRTKKDGSRMGKGSVLTEQEYSNHSAKIIEKFSYMLNNNGEIPEKFRTKKFSQKVLPSTWDQKGPTITVTSAPDDYVHFSQARSLTVREWARLQTFPDWYLFAGKRTTGGIRRAGNPRSGIFERELPKYTQIGNAVPVVLAEKIGINFMNLLEENDA